MRELKRAANALRLKGFDVEKNFDPEPEFNPNVGEFQPDPHIVVRGNLTTDKNMKKLSCTLDSKEVEVLKVDGAGIFNRARDGYVKITTE